MKLYEIDKAIRDLFDEETGEILDEEAYEQLQIDREKKIESIGILIKEAKAESEAIKAEINNLMSRLKQVNNRMERLLNYMKFATGGENFKTTKVQALWRRSEQIQILDEKVIPEKYLKIETVRKPVKDLIKKAIKGGEEVNGAVLVENKTLSVK